MHIVGDRMGLVVSARPRPLYSQERPITHCTRGLVSLGAGLDGKWKFRSPPGFGPWTVQPVAIHYWLWYQKVLPVRCKGYCRKELCAFAGQLTRHRYRELCCGMRFVDRERACVMTHYWLACCFLRHGKLTGRVVSCAIVNAVTYERYTQSIRTSPDINST